MTPILLIIFGLIIIGLTIWDIRREEADMLFWMDCLWWNVNKTENPILFRIAVVAQFAAAVIMVLIGVGWLVYF